MKKIFLTRVFFFFLVKMLMEIVVRGAYDATDSN